MGATPAPTGASRAPPLALNGRKTDRLRLRQPTPEAAVLIVEGVNQPPPTHVIGDRGIRPPDEARAYIATGPAAMVARYGFGLGAVELKDGGTPIGICGLIKRETLPDVDFGFALLERCWRQG